MERDGFDLDTNKVWRRQMDAKYDELEYSHFNVHFRQSVKEDIPAAYLFNFKPFEFDDDKGLTQSALLLFFVGTDMAADTSIATSPHANQDTGTQHFKAILVYQPYFYVVPAAHLTATQLDELRDYLKRKFQDKLAGVSILEKEDLEMHNHLSGKKRTVLKLSFFTVNDLVTIRNDLQSTVRRNKAKREGMLGGTDTQHTRTGGSDYSVIVSSSQGLFTSEADFVTGGGKVRVSSTDTLQSHRESLKRADQAEETMSAWIVELREYDVHYHVRAAIDNELRVSRWYRLSLEGSEVVKFELRTDLLTKPDLRILAYDLETTKAALKFPDPSRDQIMLVSYMIDGKGFLITNREVISQDIQDFEYTPKPSMEGVFTVFNMPNERKLIQRFFEHIQQAKPQVYVTFNGDYFDWPFLQKRAVANGLDLLQETGVSGPLKVGVGNEVYTGRHCVHMDCFYWVQRDGYLPQGSHGLKAVTRAKLGYSPVELDPQKMLPYAEQHPQQLCTYSASDAVATYYLYKKMIHDFIFALCTIVPSTPDQVLRKGSGTLCEELLMAQAFRGNILFPNKKKQMFQRFHDGHLLDSETYIGGKVECLRSGVFRDDLPVSFTIDPKAYAKLRGAFNQILEFVLEKENNVDVTYQKEMWRKQSKEGAEEPIKISEDESDQETEQDFEYLKEIVTNYDALLDNISHKLEAIEKKAPVIFSNPLIYHVDVAAMYPNIILSNRLQPVAVVKPETCASCCFNQEKNQCKRYMQWQWKGDYFPLSRIEYESIKRTLANERYPAESVGVKYQQHDHWRSKRKPSVFVKKSLLGGGDRAFHQLPLQQQHTLIRDKVKQYSQKMYGVYHRHSTEIKEDVVCMRENPFYVDTLRDFRDRRYEYKRLVKVWRKKLGQASNLQQEREAANFATLYESLQLAHKIILNSFYGYVMRKGARWYSMEMAAMVTHTGGSIIMDTKQLFDRIGMPLELDTDGIWTLLPSGFPENYNIKLSLFSKPKSPVKQEEGILPREEKQIGFSYPCSVSNILVYDKYANDQYQTRRADGRYDIKREMSIFFEIDGPYKCMFLPASRQEGRLLKKRYAVFEKDGRMSELKGFEMKRRGELQLIKIFQSEVFQYYLKGSSLAECYRACGEVADQWFDILESEGSYLSDEELLGYIEEMRVLSKNIAEYGEKKATSLTCAKRLAQFLGEEIIRDKHLNAKFIISAKPAGRKVAERAIPTAIFETEPAVKYKYLRLWLSGSGGGALLPQQELEIRKLLDWEYYKERMRNTVQKLIIIPAALQGVSNPCQSPSLTPPPWLSKKRVRSKEGQTDLSFYFNKTGREKSGLDDIEDIGRATVTPPRPRNAILPQSRLEVDSSHKVMTTASVLKEASANKELTPQKQPVDTQKSGSNRQEVKRVTSADLIKKVPKITESFTSWLRAQKEVWRVLPSELKSLKIQRRGIMNFTVDRTGITGITMTARQVAQAHINSQFYNRYIHWHILEVRESRPGVFKIFIMPQNPATGQFGVQEALSFSLQEQRVVYINSKVKQETSHLYQQVERALPREKLAYYLYESTMEEEFFRENSALFDGFLGDREIEGVYETQLPLLFNVLLRLGCMAKPVFKRAGSINTGTSRQSKLDIYTSQSAKKRENPYNPDLATHLFKTEDFLRVNALQAGQYGYLPNQSFCKAILLHLPCSPQRGMWMLYVQGKRAIHMFCVSPHPPTTFAQPNLLRAYQSSFQGENGTHELLNVSLHSYFVKTNAQVTLALDHILSQDCMPQSVIRKRAQSSTKRKSAGTHPRGGSNPRSGSQITTRVSEKPTVVIIESPIETSDLTDTPYNMSSLEELPVMRVAARKTGGGVRVKGGLPALDWQRIGTSVLAKRLVELVDYELMERLELSRFAEVPLCNLEGCDPHLQIIDILVGRILRNEKHLLWFSAQPLPDLGRELANFQECGTGVSTNTLRLQDLYEEMIQNPEVVRPGLYRSYVVEVEIEMLAVDSLLYKKHLEKLENYIEPNFTSKQARQMIMADQDFDEYGQTHPTFKIISQLANDLYVQSLGSSHEGAKMAAYQVLQHLQQWFASQSSSLYDPWLHRVLNRVMRKVLGRLLSRLEELGATVVYASFYKVVIATQKHSYEEARQHVQYMLDSVGQLDLFSKLVMIPQTYWKILLFKDRNNYAGVSQEASQVLSKMSIAHHLPAAVEPQFHIVIADFLQVLFAQLKKIIAQEKPDAPLSFEKRDMELLQFAKHYINRTLSQKMFQLVKVLNPRRDPDGYLAASVPQDLGGVNGAPYQASLSKFQGFQQSEMTDQIDDGYRGSGYAQAEIDEMHNQVKRQLMGLDRAASSKREKRKKLKVEKPGRNVLEDSDQQEHKEDVIELDLVKQEFSEQKKWEQMDQKEESDEDDRGGNLMVLEDEDSLDDFIVEDNPNDIGNIQAQKELAQMFGAQKHRRHQQSPARHPAFGFEDSMPHSRVMNEAWEFRTTVGSIAEVSGAPAVQFLNYVCEVLGLEKELEIEILSLKKNCLFFLDTPETTDLTDFKEPSGSLLIPNTICPQCQNQVDLDLCHTDVLYERERGQESEIGAGRPMLVCQLCGGQYEHQIMQAALLEACARKIDGAQMQDLKCTKCSCVKNTEMGEGCDVCGSYKGHSLTVGTEERPNAAKNLLSNSIDLKVMLRVMKRVADQFHFEVLQDYVDMLQGYH